MSKGAPPGVRITQKDIAEAVELDFSGEVEKWNTYPLEDGTTLKVKLVVRGVKRLKKYNPDGTPLYIVNSQNIVRAINIPEELKLKEEDSSFKPV